jgi:2-polyprenyl-3-methyl-5-hydroxy-6-metoxy-1,4-benzoquinol methylase|tara:strand:- start:965 stop:1621 length:657 start_codon:yes stop_codon:yes gene_type:complete
MKKEYFKNLEKTNKYNWDNQLILKSRALKTFESLMNTFLNKKINKGDFLLDLGSANGALLEIAKNKGLEVKGLDIDQINFENEKINLENESCDVITAVSLIEHIQDPSMLMSEVKRLLKKDGCFIIVTPNWTLNYKNFFDDPTHVHPYSAKSLRYLLEINGFNKIKVLPWLVCKPSWMWKIPFNFFIAKLIPFRGDASKWLPNILKGKTKTLLSICTK